MALRVIRGTAIFWTQLDEDRGRDASYLAPPAQNRTGPIRAYGFHLGYLTANRTSGQAPILLLS
jgi:hypothetical protein